MNKKVVLVSVFITVLMTVFFWGSNSVFAMLVFQSDTYGANSDIVRDGVIEYRQILTDQPSLAETSGEYGNYTAVEHAYTRGTAAANEITANATFYRQPFLSNYEIDFRVESGAGIHYRCLVEGRPSQDVRLDFYLPPGLLELRTNMELSNLNPLEANIYARLVVNVLNNANFPNEFEFEAKLFNQKTTPNGGYDDYIIESNASCDNALLDLSSLTHNTLTISEQEEGFWKTFLWESPEFYGHLLLGDLPVGTDLTVDYYLIAEVKGGVDGAAASINDPFFLGECLTFAETAVPIPGAIWLLGSGLVGLIGLRKKLNKK